MSSLSRDGFGNRDTFLGSLMRQHGSAHHIAHGIYIRQIGAAIAVDFNITPIIQFQPDIFPTQVQPCWERGRPRQSVYPLPVFVRCPFVLGVGIFHRDTFFAGFDSAYFDTRFYHQA